MKKICITGATSGIGKALAQAYLAEGWHVFACGRKIDKLSDLAKQNKNLSLLSFDVSNKEETKKVLGSLDHGFELIILNAGTCEYIEKGKIDSAVFQRVFATNFFGILHCIEALQTHFTTDTHLALMGSTASYLPFPRSEAYGASKAAVAYLAHSLAVDLQAAGITVSLISPGFVETPLTNKNDFSMPMIIKAEEAAKLIISQLANKKIDIHFPRKFSYMLKFISLFPIQLQRKIMYRLSRNAK